MSRKRFYGLIYDLYRCKERGVTNETTKAATSVYDAGDVEVFNSPAGLLVAIYHGPTWNNVTLIKPVPPEGVEPLGRLN